jgi:hypothetical protein
MWMLTLHLCCFAYVGPWGREVEVVQELDRQDPTEPRAGQRHRQDDTSVGPSREPHRDIEVVLEDLHRWFEWVL